VQINATFPVLPSSTDVGFAGSQTKVSAGAAEKPQTQEAIEASPDVDSDGDEGNTVANKGGQGGRGSLVDIKV
jgi:hypothetical protein